MNVIPDHETLAVPPGSYDADWFLAQLTGRDPDDVRASAVPAIEADTRMPEQQSPAESTPLVAEAASHDLEPEPYHESESAVSEHEPDPEPAAEDQPVAEQHVPADVPPDVRPSRRGGLTVGAIVALILVAGVAAAASTVQPLTPSPSGADHSPAETGPAVRTSTTTPTPQLTTLPLPVPTPTVTPGEDAGSPGSGTAPDGSPGAPATDPGGATTPGSPSTPSADPTTPEPEPSPSEPEPEPSPTEPEPEPSPSESEPGLLDPLFP